MHMHWLRAGMVLAAAIILGTDTAKGDSHYGPDYDPERGIEQFFDDFLTPEEAGWTEEDVDRARCHIAASREHRQGSREWHDYIEVCLDIASVGRIDSTSPRGLLFWIGGGVVIAGTTAAAVIIRRRRIAGR